jgi:hypothetical protein
VLDRSGALPGHAGFYSAEQGQADCAQASSQILFHRRWEAPASTEVTPLTLSHATGAVTWGKTTRLPTFAHSATQSGGRWFVTGLPLTTDGSRFMLYELSNDASFRDIPLYVVNGRGANPGTFYPPLLAFFQPHDVLATKDALVVTATAGTSGSNLNDRLAPGESSPAAFALYRVSCP